MPRCPEELVTKTNESGVEKTNVAKKTGIRATCFWVASEATLATLMSIPELIRAGILDADGKRKFAEWVPDSRIISSSDDIYGSIMIWSFVLPSRYR